MLDLFVIAPPGLEAACAAELRGLGASGVAVQTGGITCSGEPRTLARLNIGSRIASRVLVRLCEAPPGDLRRALAQVDFGAFLEPGEAFVVDVAGGGSRPGELSRPVEEAIAKAVPRARAAGKAEPAQTFAVRLAQGRVTVSVDASGEHLHLRGYRQETGVAPLRENLAAGILALAGWTGDTPLFDPMCGSGTFLIEGALQALRRAPGLERAFASERWPCMDPEAVAAAREALRAAERAAPPAPLVGADKNAGSLGVARRNAQRAGILEHLQLSRADATAAEPPADGPGLVVTNPPYGKRVGEERELADLYRRFGARLRECFSGWTAAVLVPDPRLEAHLGLSGAQAFALRNGGLPTRLLVAQL